MTTLVKTTAAPAQSYAAAYAKLAAIADKLRAAGSAASVDSLVEDLREARSAYAICRARLDAIRSEVDAEMALVPEAVAPRG